MKKPYIFFDFDGTLLDTNNIIVDSWNYTAMHFFGHELPRETWEKTFGETLRFTAGNFFPSEDVEEVLAVYRDWQLAHAEGNIALFDGCVELLDELKKRGYKFALVTSRTHATTYEYLEQCGVTDYFDVIVDCDSTPAHKPDPEPLLLAIRKMSECVGKELRLDECIMLGDTRFDTLCCKNAGVESVLVEWSHEVDEEQLAELGALPDYRIAKPMDLLAII